MKKKIIAGLLMAMLLVACIAGGRTTAFAADSDVVLNDAGSPLIRVIDPGEGSDYTYMGYVYCGEGIDDSYRYLSLTYSGDATALSQLRLEILDGTGTKIGVFWFSENAEGNFITTEGTLLPAPTDTEQTAIIDLAASGIDMSKGVQAMHIHDTQGTGKLIISDARFMKNADGTDDTAADNTAAEDTTAAEDNTAAEDTAAAGDNTAAEDNKNETASESTENNTSTDDSASTGTTPAATVVTTTEDAGSFNPVPVIIVCVGIVFVVACVVVRKIIIKKKK